MTEDTSPENLRKFLESDDPAMVRMGLSMAKGAGVLEELLPTILSGYKNGVGFFNVTRLGRYERGTVERSK